MFWGRVKDPTRDFAAERKRIERDQRIAKEAREAERQRCAGVVADLLVKQRQTNLENPAHAEAYPEWRGRVLGLEAALAALDRKEPTT